MSLLEVRDLRVRFGRRRPAVDQVSFTIDRGERLGVIGESGSGKTVTALAVMGLLAENAVVSGSVELAGHAITALPERDLARLRGDLVTMVFQEPMTALDPPMPVGRQVAETLLLHADVERGSARARVIEVEDALRTVGMWEHADDDVATLSGGQRQRAILAMALINAPQLVICDEPTTALDVTVQAQVLAKLDQALTASGAACLFISHDLAVVSQICDRVLVMLAGRIVERGTVAELFSAPQHPYTRGLVEAASLDRIEPGQRLPTVAGLLDDPAGES